MTNNNNDYIDLNPESFSEGGGLIDDFDGTISDIRFILTDYGGNMTDPVAVAQVVFDTEEGENETVLYSVGGKDDFAPDEKGMGLVKLKTKSSLTKTAKFPMLLKSLVENGFPVNKMDNRDISYLVGFKGHFLRTAVEYKGLAKKKNDRENTVLLCTKVETLPWEAGKATKGKGKAKAGAKVDPDLAEFVTETIMGIVIEGDDEMSKKDMISILFKNEDVKARDDRKAVLALANKDAFLKSRDEWSIENNLLTIG